MKKILLYLAVGLSAFLVVNYLTSCNVVNKSRSVEKKNVDSTVTNKVDSSKLLSHDSASVKKETTVDSSRHKHIDDKKLVITFDTSHHLDVGHVIPYQYEIDNKKITSAQPITSAVIDDSNEDDSSASSVHNNSDSVAVHSLDTSRVKKDGSTHLQGQTKAVTTTKESKRTSPWFIGALLILVIIGGYFGGKKLGFFR